MAASSPVVLILGAGANVGAHVAKAFAAKGYRVVLAARKSREAENTSTQIHIQSDFSDPSSIATTFAKVKSAFGLPSVVVYNAAAVTFNDAKNPLTIPLADFARDLNVNVNSAYAAAQEAVRAFEQLPESASRTFIYTGNGLNKMTMAPVMDLGVGKSATSHIIEVASKAYQDRGYKFYYADERKTDGAPVGSGLSGAAHAEHYTKLAETKTQEPWQQTFVAGEGYKSFL